MSFGRLIVGSGTRKDVGDSPFFDSCGSETDGRGRVTPGRLIEGSVTGGSEIDGNGRSGSPESPGSGGTVTPGKVIGGSEGSVMERDPSLRGVEVGFGVGCGL